MLHGIRWVLNQQGFTADAMRFFQVTRYTSKKYNSARKLSGGVRWQLGMHRSEALSWPGTSQLWCGNVAISFMPKQLVTYPIGVARCVCFWNAGKHVSSCVDMGLRIRMGTRDAERCWTITTRYLSNCGYSAILMIEKWIFKILVFGAETQWDIMVGFLDT